MIKITGQDGLTINYKCSCGVIGRCMLKPMESGIIIANITCPVCLSNQQVRMKRSNNDKGYSWAYVVTNEVMGYELKEGLC